MPCIFICDVCHKVGTAVNAFGMWRIEAAWLKQGGTDNGHITCSAECEEKYQANKAKE